MKLSCSLLPSFFFVFFAASFLVITFAALFLIMRSLFIFLDGVGDRCFLLWEQILFFIFYQHFILPVPF